MYFNVAGTTHKSLWVSVFVYYVAVRTIVLSRHRSNLARPVIIHDIIHSLMCMPSTPHCWFFGVPPDGNCAHSESIVGYFTSNLKSVRRAHLNYVVFWAPRHDIAPSVYGCEIMALGFLVSESFLAYQFLLYTKCLGGKEDWNPKAEIEFDDLGIPRVV